MADSQFETLSAPPPQTWIRVLSTVLKALGVPAAVWLVGSRSQSLADYAKTHPFKVLGLLSLYEAGVFIAEVWRRIRPLLVEMSVDWVQRVARAFFSRYERDYRKHVYYHCRVFDVKGLSIQGPHSLKLERVFVELSIVPHRPDTRTLDLLLSEPSAQSQEFWSYFEQEGHFAVIGAPGSGKTTLLRYVALTLAKGRRKKCRQTLPILLYLRSHAKAISDNKDLSLQDAILTSEVVREQSVQPPPDWFNNKLRKGKCLILLDGLDEVADSASRAKVVEWVERQMRTHPDCRFCITSRPHGYVDNPLSGVTTLRVEPLKPDKVREFVSNWYLANEVMSHNKEDEGVRIEAKREAEKLMARILGSEVLIDLSVNPLLLTMIATVHRFSSKLPERRVELYRQICEVFLGKWRAVRVPLPELDLTPDQKRFVLESLAFHLMTTQNRVVPAQEAADAIKTALRTVSPNTQTEVFLRMVEASSGLLLEREQGIYSFAHKTFQEYLAAVYIRSNRLEHLLAEKIDQEWWHETIRLYVAEGDATPILEACFRQVPLRIQPMILAIDCIQEAQRVDPSWRQRLENLITDSDEQHRRLFGEAMLVIRQRRLTRVNETNAVDTTFLTNAEYQVFIDEMGDDRTNLAPRHWEEGHFSKGEGSFPVAVLLYSQADAFCRWMTSKFGGSSWEFRIPSKSMLQSVTLSDAKQQTVQDEMGCWIDDGTLVGGERNLDMLYTAAKKLRHFSVAVREASFCHQALDSASILSNYTLSGVDLTPAIAALTGLAHVLAVVLARDLYADLIPDFAHDLALTRNRTRARQLADVLDQPVADRDLDAIVNLAKDLALDLRHALIRAGGIPSNLDPDLIPDVASAFDAIFSILTELIDIVRDQRLLLRTSVVGNPNRAHSGSALTLARNDRARTLARDLDDCVCHLAQYLDRTGAITDSRLDRFSFMHLMRDSVSRYSKLGGVLLNEMCKGVVIGGIRIAKTRRPFPVDCYQKCDHHGRSSGSQNS